MHTRVHTHSCAHTLMWEGGAEWERHRIWSGLQALSCQHRARRGLKLTDRKIMTWAKVGHLTDWATQAPLKAVLILKVTTKELFSEDTRALQTLQYQNYSEEARTEEFSIGRDVGHISRVRSHGERRLEEAPLAGGKDCCFRTLTSSLFTKPHPPSPEGSAE